MIGLGEGMSAVSREGNVVAAQAGATLARVSAFAQGEGLSGLEFASGIPGTLGGGCAMNAGAYGGQLSDLLIDAEVFWTARRAPWERRGEGEGAIARPGPLREGGVVLWRFPLTPDDPRGSRRG